MCWFGYGLAAVVVIVFAIFGRLEISLGSLDKNQIASSSSSYGPVCAESGAVRPLTLVRQFMLGADAGEYERVLDGLRIKVHRHIVNSAQEQEFFARVSSTPVLLQALQDALDSPTVDDIWLSDEFLSDQFGTMRIEHNASTAELVEKITGRKLLANCTLGSVSSIGMVHEIEVKDKINRELNSYGMSYHAHLVSDAQAQNFIGRLRTDERLKDSIRMAREQMGSDYSGVIWLSDEFKADTYVLRIRADASTSEIIVALLGEDALVAEWVAN
jgi:hypothetical protein